MGSLSYFLYLFLFSFFLLTSLASSSTFLSNEVFESSGSTGRALLQIKRSCSIDFESQNYTIITSRCKEPQYTAEACCNAFKDFACPFADDINDQRYDCASTMFSYIHLHGKYPPGLFSSMCREGMLGLNCTTIVEKAKAESNGDLIAATQPIILS